MAYWLRYPREFFVFLGYLEAGYSWDIGDSWCLQYLLNTSPKIFLVKNPYQTPDNKGKVINRLLLQLSLIRFEQLVRDEAR